VLLTARRHTEPGAPQYQVGLVQSLKALGRWNHILTVAPGPFFCPLWVCVGVSHTHTGADDGAAAGDLLLARVSAAWRLGRWATLREALQCVPASQEASLSRAVLALCDNKPCAAIAAAHPVC
jgi:hypothetical protein